MRGKMRGIWKMKDRVMKKPEMKSLSATSEFVPVKLAQWMRERTRPSSDLNLFLAVLLSTCEYLKTDTQSHTYLPVQYNWNYS